MRPRTFERWKITDAELWTVGAILLNWLSFWMDMEPFITFLSIYFTACVPRLILGICRSYLPQDKAHKLFSVLFFLFTIAMATL